MIQRICLMVLVVVALCGVEIPTNGGEPVHSKSVKNWYLGAYVTESAKVPGSTFFRGMAITGTIEDSPAHKHLKRGDVITHINKRTTNTLSEYDSALRGSGGTVNLRVRRATEFIMIRIELL